MSDEPISHKVGQGPKDDIKGISLPLSAISFILILGAYLVKGGYELVECLSVNNKTRGTFRRVANYVRRSQIIAVIKKTIDK